MDNRIEDGFSIIENAKEALNSSVNNKLQEDMSSKNKSGSLAPKEHMTIDERIVNNYYLEEYMSLNNVRTLRQQALKCGLRSYRFRSLAWMIFLECLPEKSKHRIEHIRAMRLSYEELRNKYRHDPRSMDSESLTDDNPLSQKETSHWNQYFSDDELQTRIKQDVVRAFPDINFFQTEKIQSIMVDILFNYARENPNIDYKQGMHEILAPIIFVIHSDHQSYLFAQENGLNEIEIKELMDSTYLEHDSFNLFSHIMERIESWYDTNSIRDTNPNKNEYVNVEPFSDDLDFACFSKIGIKLRMITEQILRRHDGKLYQHLKELKIAPQIYGIRWMRLLFIREFQMQDLLVLWDAIFANDFSLCDYIFVAMLVVIKSLLLPCDYAACLNHLMRYPSVCDVHYVIHLALHIRDPLNYPEPVEHSTLVLPNPNAIKAQMANLLPGESLHSYNQNQSQNSHQSKNGRQNRSHNSSPHFNQNNSNDTEYRSNKSMNEMKNISFEWIEDKLVKLQSGDFTVQQRNCCQELSQQVDELKYRTDLCSRSMTKHLEVLQKFFNNNTNNVTTTINNGTDNNENSQSNQPDLDQVLLSIAELKKIRDILRGTIAI